MLDIACGAGRHAIAASELGADVVAVDSNNDAMDAGRAIAAKKGLAITWKCADLQTLALPEKAFDIVMAFNYLDRKRMDDFKRALRPGGHFLYETFLEGQHQFGWGPSSDEHILKRGELLALVRPFEILFAREVIEAVDSRSAAISSVLATRRE